MKKEKEVVNKRTGGVKVALESLPSFWLCIALA